MKSTLTVVVLIDDRIKEMIYSEASSPVWYTTKLHGATIYYLWLTPMGGRNVNS